MFTLEKIKTLPKAYRFLNSLYYRNFGVFTNESLKKDFEEKLKEKYFTQRQQGIEDNEDSRLNLYNEMKEAYQDIFQGLRNQGFIIPFLSTKLFRQYLKSI